MSDISSNQIINTKQLDQFDKLTQLAVKICKADVSYISFFDEDRQWLKSKVGLDVSEFQLSRSICNYLVKHNLSHLNIPDLSLDDTFKEHFAFKDSGFRFYSGFPLIGPDKAIVGSFCVLGFTPRKLDEVQLEFLKTMADQTMILFESQKLKNQIKIEEDRLQKDRKAIDQRANYYKSLVDNSTFYICKVTKDGTLKFCNDLYSKEFGIDVPNGTDSGKYIFHAVTEDYLGLAVNALQVVTSGSELKRRILIKEINKNRRVVLNVWDFIGLKNSEGEVYEILCFGNDISEWEENSSQIQLLTDYTAFQNKKSLEYNTFVFHNIRSHVANASGLISLLDLINDEEEYNDYFKLLKQEIKNTDLSILALNRISAANADFENSKEPISLYHLIEYVFELLRRTKPNHNFSSVNNVAEELIVYSVREYLENVFLNVLSNSLKFISSKRAMIIGIDALQITDTILQIKINDNGKGMDLEKYGGDFFKITSPTNDSKEAKGIELYLAKKQIEALGGNIKIQSEFEKGSEVLLELINYEN